MFRYPSVFGALRTIYRTEGLAGGSMGRLTPLSMGAGCFRGTAATVLRDAPFSGIYLLVYTRCKHALALGSDTAAKSNVSILHSATAGFLAGAVASLLTHPQVSRN